MTGQFPSPPGNLGQYLVVSKTQPLELGARKAQQPQGERWSRGRKAGGARGRRAPEPAEETPRPPGRPRALGRLAPGDQSPSRVSAAANLGEPGGGDQQRHAKRRSQALGGDGRGAAGAGTLGGQRGRHPGPALGARSGPGRDRSGLAGGWARCLRPGCCAAHLRHFLAAAPQTLARAPGEREGGGRRAEGRGRRGGQRPGWLRSDPGRLGSHRGLRAPPSWAEPRRPRPAPPVRPPGLTALPSAPTPGHGRPAPDPQARGFYLGSTTGAWDTKPQIAATGVRSPLQGAGISPE